MVNVVVPCSEILCTEAEPFHDTLHIVGPFGVKQDIMVGHLPHTVHGVEMLQYDPLQRHVPDARRVQLGKEHIHLRVHRGVFQDGTSACLGEVFILHPGGLQRRGHGCRKHVSVRQPVQRIQIHARDLLRFRLHAVDGA